MTYKEKKEELITKYEKELTLIAQKRGMTLDEAWDVLDTYGRGFNKENPFIDAEELAKDCNDLYEVAKSQVGK